MAKFNLFKMKIIRPYIYLLIAITLAVLAMLAVSGAIRKSILLKTVLILRGQKNVQDSNRLLRQEVEKLTGDIQQLIYAGFTLIPSISKATPLEIPSPTPL